MKKNKIITASMVALLSISTLGAGTAAFAANGADGDTVDGIKQTGTTGITTATITFDKDTDEIINPTLPINPNQEIKPGADLSFVYITSEIGFGTHKAGIKSDFNGETGDQEYSMDAGVANPVSGTNKFQMEVMDARPGENEGWHVTGEFETDIVGLKLTFPKTTELFYAGAAVEGNALTNEAVFDGNGSSATIFKTDTGKSGFGRYSFQEDVKDIKMHFPAEKQKNDTFTGTIKWTLNEGPDGSTL